MTPELALGMPERIAVTHSGHLAGWRVVKRFHRRIEWSLGTREFNCSSRSGCEEVPPIISLTKRRIELEMLSTWRGFFDSCRSPRGDGLDGVHTKLLSHVIKRRGKNKEAKGSLVP